MLKSGNSIWYSWHEIEISCPGNHVLSRIFTGDGGNFWGNFFGLSIFSKFPHLLGSTQDAGNVSTNF